jgi:hypothetical protein
MESNPVGADGLIASFILNLVKRRRYSRQVTCSAGGSAQWDDGPGSVEQNVIRQNGVTT